MADSPQDVLKQSLAHAALPRYCSMDLAKQLARNSAEELPECWGVAEEVSFPDVVFLLFLF